MAEGRNGRLRDGLPLLIGISLFAAFRLVELTRYSLWYDEIFAVSIASSDWNELLAAVAADRTNPPLFYLLLKVWMGVGGVSVAWLRLLPCLIAIVGVGPLVALARVYGLSARSTVVALAAAAASPLMVTLANEIRAYSLLFLLGAASLWAWKRFVASADETDVRLAVTLAAINAGLVYTHYFGWLVVGAEGVATLLWYRQHLRIFALTVVAVAALFAPWAWTVWREAAHHARPLENVEWITRPAFADLVRFYDALTARVIAVGWEWVGAVVFLVPLGALAVKSALRAHRDALPRTAELALLALLPTLIVFVASLTLARSAFVPRYLIVAAPAWFLLVALSVDALSARHATLVAGAFALFTLGAGAAQRVRGGEKIPWEAIVARIANSESARGTGAQGARGTSAEGGPGIGATSPIFVFEGFTALPVAWYLRSSGAPPLRLVSARSLDALDEATSGWVIYRERSFAEPGAPEARVRALGRTVETEFRERTLSQEIVAFRFGGAPAP
jgi:hypothetical protein